MTGKSVRQFKDLSGQYPIFNFDRTSPMTGRYLQPCMKVLKWTNGMKAFHYAISLMFKQAVGNEEQFVTNS